MRRNSLPHGQFCYLSEFMIATGGLSHERPLAPARSAPSSVSLNSLPPHRLAEDPSHLDTVLIALHLRMWENLAFTILFSSYTIYDR